MTIVGISLLTLAAIVLVVATVAAASTRRQAWSLTAGLLWLGVGCFAAYAAIGTSIDETGVLHEQFTLMPIGWMFVLTGLGSAALTTLNSVRLALR